jgi:two-component system response regulator AtoC
MKTILVIDNDKEFRHMLGDVLSTRDYQTIFVSDGYNGIIQAGKKKPDVILLDIRMPSMNGLTALERLKTEAPTASIPVIVISGTASEEQIDKAKSGGAFSFLAKPFSLEDLFVAIEKAAASKV